MAINAICVCLHGKEIIILKVHYSSIDLSVEQLFTHLSQFTHKSLITQNKGKYNSSSLLTF